MKGIELSFRRLQCAVSVCTMSGDTLSSDEELAKALQESEWAELSRSEEERVAQPAEEERDGEEITALALDLSDKLRPGGCCCCCSKVTGPAAEAAEHTRLNKRLVQELIPFGEQTPGSADTIYRLTELSLSDNMLVSLPTHVMEMHWLVTLTLSDNSLTALPSLATLTKLKSLELDHNMLDTFDTLADLNTLSRLNVSHNYLSRPIPDAFCQLLNLKFLLANHNDIGGMLAVSRLPNLVLLDLSHNVIVDVPPLEAPDLRVLKLASNRISAVLGDFIAPKLNELDLEDNELTVRNCSIFVCRHVGL